MHRPVAKAHCTGLISSDFFQITTLTACITLKIQPLWLWKVILSLLYMKIKSGFNLCYFFFFNTVMEEATVKMFFEALSSLFVENKQAVDILKDSFDLTACMTFWGIGMRTALAFNYCYWHHLMVELHSFLDRKCNNKRRLEIQASTSDSFVLNTISKT